MIKAIIFDADNTLYNTSEVAKIADMVAMQFFSKQTSKTADQLYDEWKSIVNRVRNSKDPKKRHRLYSYTLLGEKNRLTDIKKAYEIFFDCLIKNLKLEPTLLKTLNELKQFKLVLISEDFEDQLIKKLRKFGIKKYFNTIITSNQTKIMKPSKAYYEFLFKKLRLKPKECIVIGDSYEKDLDIPKRMGCVIVMYGNQDDRTKFSIYQLKEIIQIIKRINS